MLKQCIKFPALVACAVLLTACNGFFEKDNTPPPSPLVKFAPEIKPLRTWSTSTGTGTGDDYLKFTPAINATSIFVAGTNGTVTSVNRANGRINWRTYTGSPITSPVGEGDGLVVVGDRKGIATAIRAADGKLLWHASVPGEILAKPAIADGIVIIKAIDGYVCGLSAADGHLLWSSQQVEPNMVLRGSSTPLIRDHNVIAGFANGNLAKISLRSGQLQWAAPVAMAEGAFAIQRMIDIDADPIVYGHQIYAATYQGKIASLDWQYGRTIWSHDISSYTGMTTDGRSVYISDARSLIWDFNAETGNVNWRQDKLADRVITGPASMGNYIVVGDGEGYLHWLNKNDGHLAAREKLSGAIYATPIVDNNTLYVLNNRGYLAAYVLSQ